MMARVFNPFVGHDDQTTALQQCRHERHSSQGFELLAYTYKDETELEEQLIKQAAASGTDAVMALGRKRHKN